MGIERHEKCAVVIAFEILELAVCFGSQNAIALSSLCLPLLAAVPYPLLRLVNAHRAEHAARI